MRKLICYLARATDSDEQAVLAGLMAVTASVAGAVLFEALT
jgi:hypothetical protein